MQFLAKKCFCALNSKLNSGTEHWLLKTSFHPLLWTSSGLRETEKLYLTWVLRGSMRMLRTCEKLCGVVRLA